MFLLSDTEGYIRYVLTLDDEGMINAIHTPTDKTQSEDDIKDFMRIMQTIEDYKFIDISGDPVSLQDKILEDFKESENDINVKDYTFESVVVL